MKEEYEDFDFLIVILLYMALLEKNLTKKIKAFKKA